MHGAPASTFGLAPEEFYKYSLLVRPSLSVLYQMAINVEELASSRGHTHTHTCVFIYIYTHTNTYVER